MKPVAALFIALSSLTFAAETAPDPKAAGWVALGKADFVPVNGAPDTWQWKEDGILHCTGKPVGVMRTVKEYKNFEMAVSWCHLKDAGNSGVFVWAPKDALDKLTKPGLPDAGIEVQVLDPGFTAAYEKSSGKKGDWFTCHGDVFAVGRSKMTPFPPLSPNGSRSFPTQQTTKSTGEWNHYLIRAVDGTIRLWVNGAQVSGGEKCEPSQGFLCLESEGSPIDFKDIKIREITK
jgi:hypothetical protein